MSIFRIFVNNKKRLETNDFEEMIRFMRELISTTSINDIPTIRIDGIIRNEKRSRRIEGSSNYIPTCDICGELFCSEHVQIKEDWDEIKTISIDKIIPNKKSYAWAKNQTDYLEWIKMSIEKEGLKNPLIIDKNYKLLTGHHRYYVLKNILKWKKVKVVIL